MRTTRHQPNEMLDALPPSAEHDEPGLASHMQLGSHDVPPPAAAPAAVRRPAAVRPAPTAAATRPRPRAVSRTPMDVALVFAVVAAAQVWITGGLGAIEFDPHPYWALVLPIAASRGLLAAMTAAVCATVLYGVGAVEGGRVAGYRQLLDVQIMLEPLLFFGVGYLVGELRDRLATRNVVLAERVASLEDEARQRERTHRVLRSANRELRRRLFDDPTDFESVLAAVSRLDPMSSTNEFDEPLRLVEERCGVTKCSILVVLSDGSVDLARHRGWGPDEILQKIEDANGSVFVQRAIAEAIPIHCFHPNVTAPRVGPLLVAPILDATGAVTALLCLDEIPPKRVHASTVQTFVAIGSWLASSLRDRADRYLSDSVRAAVGNIQRGQRSLGNPRALARRLIVEDSRSARQGTPAALLTLHAVDLEARIPGAVDRLERFLLTKIYRDLRLSDDIYRFGYPGYYVVVLAGTTRGDAGAFRDRIVEQVGESGDPTIGRIVVDVFSPGIEAACLVDLIDDIARNYNGGELPDDYRRPSVRSDTVYCGNAVEFAARLRLELGIAMRFSQEIGLIDFHGDEDTSDAGEMISRHLVNLPGMVLRPSDGVFVLKRNRCVVLMPHTDSLDTSRVWERLEQQLRKTIPLERLQKIRSEFLSVDGTEAMLAVEHFLGREEDSGKELLSSQELQELSFSDDEFDEISQGHGFFEDGGDAPQGFEW